MMTYDFYKLYLGNDIDGYSQPRICDDLDEIEFKLNRETIHDKYLVIGHNNNLDMDQVVAQGRIELNRTRKKGR